MDGFAKAISTVTPRQVRHSNRGVIHASHHAPSPVSSRSWLSVVAPTPSSSAAADGADDTPRRSYSTCQAHMMRSFTRPHASARVAYARCAVDQTQSGGDKTGGDLRVHLLRIINHGAQRRKRNLFQAERRRVALNGRNGPARTASAAREATQRGATPPSRGNRTSVTRPPALRHVVPRQPHRQASTGTEAHCTRTGTGTQTHRYNGVSPSWNHRTDGVVGVCVPSIRLLGLLALRAR